MTRDIYDRLRREVERTELLETIVVLNHELLANAERHAAELAARARERGRRSPGRGHGGSLRRYAPCGAANSDGAPTVEPTRAPDWATGARQPTPLPSVAVGHAAGKHRLIRRAVVLIATCCVLAAGCSSSDVHSGSAVTRPGTPASTSAPATLPSPPSTTVWSLRADAFAATDTALDQRVSAAGLSGGTIRVVADDGTVLHEYSTGAVTPSTALDLASSTKWLTAATLMTFVDRGAIALDDDIGRWLPEFAGSDPPIRVRQLLDHTSGVHDNPCQNGGVSLSACVTTLASSPREFAAGSAFSYGNAPYLVVGRLVEVLGGADFASVVRDRLTGPLGMTDTTWPGAPGAPNPAFGARSTADDYGKFLAMLLHDGTAGGTRVLSSAAVREITRNQVGAYDTTHDDSVGITQIPRYGLGCWIDVQADDGATRVVSGNGGKGFYPWVDFTTRTWGVIGLQDDRGAEVGGAGVAERGGRGPRRAEPLNPLPVLRRPCSDAVVRRRRSGGRGTEGVALEAPHLAVGVVHHVDGPRPPGQRGAARLGLGLHPGGARRPIRAVTHHDPLVADLDRADDRLRLHVKPPCPRGHPIRRT